MLLVALLTRLAVAEPATGTPAPIPATTPATVPTTGTPAPIPATTPAAVPASEAPAPPPESPPATLPAPGTPEPPPAPTPATIPAPFALHVPDDPAAVRDALAALVSDDGSPILLVWTEDAARDVLASVVPALPATRLAATPLLNTSVVDVRAAGDAAGSACVVWVRPGLRAWFLLPSAQGCRTHAASDTPALASLAPLLTPPPAPLTVIPDPGAPGGWAVVEGGKRVDTVGLARRLADLATVDRLAREERDVRLVDFLLGATAGLASMGAIGVFAFAPDPVDVPDQPDPARFQDLDAYTNATERWRRRQSAADLRDEAMWSGAFLLSTAGLCVALIPLTGGDARDRRQHPGLVYDEADVRKRLTIPAPVSLGVGPGWVGLVVELE